MLRALLLLVPLLLLGCDRDRALHGKWVFDRPYTEAHLAQKTQPNPDSKDFLGGMKEGLIQMLVPQLLQKLEGAEVRFTKNEMVMTTADGNGKAEKFEVLERPSANSWRLKKTDGTVETYVLEDDHLGSPATGDLHLTVYFKKAN